MWLREPAGSPPDLMWNYGRNPEEIKMLELARDGVILKTRRGMFLIPFSNIRHIEYYDA